VYPKSKRKRPWNLSECEPSEDLKIFYRINSKYRTAGFDKLVFEKMLSCYIALYINKRTGARNLINVTDNTLRVSYKIFKTVQEYFSYMEDKKDAYIYDHLSDQYFKELKQIKEKYPEYFV
jgi:hypothetical protein